MKEPHRLMDRRTFVVQALAFCALPKSQGALPLLPIAGFVGRAAAAAAIGWFVEETLDTALNRKQVEDAIVPSKSGPTGNAFHDANADSFIVDPYRVRIPTGQSGTYGFHTSLDGHLRADLPRQIPVYKDLAVHEIQRIRHEQPIYGTVLYPCGFRRPPTWEDDERYLHTLRRYEVPPHAFRLDYVRPFNDGQNQLVGFGVCNRRGDRDLLISV